MKGFEFRFKPTKPNFAKYILSHYNYYEKTNATLPEQYLTLLKSKLVTDLKKLEGKFNIKLDTLQFFSNILESESGRELFLKFLESKDDSNRSISGFISQLNEPPVEQPISEPSPLSLLPSARLDGRAICIAVYLSFEIEKKLDEYDRIYRIGIAKTQKFAAEVFKIGKIPGKQNMAGFDLHKILESKNQVKTKNQLKKQLLQIAENKTIFGDKIALRANQLINKYY